MTDLTRLLSAEILEAFERLVDERVHAALKEQEVVAPARWLTLAEAAQYTRLSQRTLERAVERQRLRKEKVGSRTLFNVDELDAFIRAAAGEDAAPTTPPRRRRGSLEPIDIEA